MIVPDGVLHCSLVMSRVILVFTIAPMPSHGPLPWPGHPNSIQTNQEQQLNFEKKRAIAVKKGIDVSACAPSLELVSATGARTSDVPPAVEFAMAVRTGRREARFFVSMLCEASKRPQLRRDSAAAGSGTGENTMRLQSRRFVPPLHEPCALSNLIRLSAMTRAEDAVYAGMETHSGDGKLCLVE